jgi:hypothetical protein
MYFFLAPPERDETGSPRSFRKDELLQFLRVCYSVIFAEMFIVGESRILVKQQIYH